MKFSVAAACFLLSFVAAAAADPLAEGDPLVGRWLWGGGNLAQFNADGTASVGGGRRGTWVFARNPEVQRKYQVVWSDGRYIDKIILSEDRQSIQVLNLQGANGIKSTFRRAVEPPRPSPAATAAVVAVPSPVPAAPAARPDVLGPWYLQVLFRRGGSARFAMDIRPDGTWTYDRKNYHGTWTVADGFLDVRFDTDPKGLDRYVLAGPAGDELQGKNPNGDTLVLRRQAPAAAGSGATPSLFGTQR